MYVLTMEHGDRVQIGEGADMIIVTAFRDVRGTWTVNGERSFIWTPEGDISVKGPHKGSLRVGFNFPRAVKIKRIGKK